jgi:ABC-type antimicrobial peptide transport system permease subunit
MAVYLPLLQFPKTTPGALFIRPRGDVRAFLGEALSTVQAMHPNLPAARGALLRDVVDPEFKPWRLGATVFSAFALVALIIASIGLYGVVTLGTSLRLKEIGIRMSIGASSADVIRVVVGEGFIAVLSGLIVGGGFALVGSRWLGGVLFETSPHDPVILFETAAVLIGVSVFAIALPTARALRTNPAIVLRVD